MARACSSVRFLRAFCACGKQMFVVSTVRDDSRFKMLGSGGCEEKTNSDLGIFAQFDGSYNITLLVIYTDLGATSSIPK